MVEVGNLEISGSINTEQIESGVSRIRLSLQSVQNEVRPLSSGINNLGGTITGLAGSFGALAAAGAGFFFQLQGAPALASTFAKISVDAEKLRRSLGGAFQEPAKIGAELFSDAVDFVDKLEVTQPGKLGGATVAGLGATALAAGALAVTGPITAGAAGTAAAVGAGVAADRFLPSPIGAIASLFGETGRKIGAFTEELFDRRFTLLNFKDAIFS